MPDQSDYCRDRRFSFIQKRVHVGETLNSLKISRRLQNYYVQHTKVQSTSTKYKYDIIKQKQAQHSTARHSTPKQLRIKIKNIYNASIWSIYRF